MIYYCNLLRNHPKNILPDKGNIGIVFCLYILRVLKQMVDSEYHRTLI